MARSLIAVFKVELDKIKDPDLKQLTKNILFDCCDYVSRGPASSTGKYHPEFSSGVGGLVRHIKAVCANVETIMKTMPQYDGEDWDIPFISAILHDCMKYTEENQQFSHENHPNRMAALIRSHKIKEKKNFNQTVEVLNNKLERIASNVETHMGRWRECKHSKELMPIPTTMENWILHCADMIAAQKYFDCKFDDKNNIIGVQ